MTGGLPLVITASGSESIMDWTSRQPDWPALLTLHGALLFRGFAADSVDRFDEAVLAVLTMREFLLEESSPRSRLSATSFTSTDHPSRYPIAFHHEYSYASRWPSRIVFGCLVPAASGGETLIADSRRVLARLTSSTRSEFARRRLCYVRNYGDGIGVSWPAAFGTEDRAEVELHCRQRGIEYAWSGDVLRTRQHAPAVVNHPESGAPLWFNHALIFNVRGIEPAHIRDVLLHDPDVAPTNSYFGDGAEIPGDVIEEIRAAYAEERVAVRWQRGDFLLLDNMLAAHARAPFTGERLIAVGMGDIVTRSRVSVPSHSDLVGIAQID
jgi:alpha-ketoglutarate-dependent taurine dioxygenase